MTFILLLKKYSVVHKFIIFSSLNLISAVRFIISLDDNRDQLKSTCVL